MKVTARPALAIVIVSIGVTSQHTQAVRPQADATRTAGSIPSAAAAISGNATVRQYCVPCHSDTLHTANLSLESVDINRPESNPEIWEKVVRKLRRNAMPPFGSRRPDQTTYAALTAWLEDGLDRAFVLKPNAGRPALHRLNRAEYRNAIRDLLALDIDVGATLPSDDSSYGFDNIADVLNLSPTLLDKYLSAARKISAQAVGDPSIDVNTDTYRLPADLTQHERLAGLPFGTRGGLQVRHHFPRSGEYDFKVTLLRNLFDRVYGVKDSSQLEISIDGRPIGQFTVGRETRDEQARAANAANARDKEEEEYEVSADKGIELRAQVEAGPRTVAVTFITRSDAYLEAVERPFLRSTSDPSGPTALSHVERLAITGPFSSRDAGDTPSRRKVFVCYPERKADEEKCASRILTRLSRQAYRGMAAAEDAATLLRFYQEGRARGTFETGVEYALRRILVSPKFLVRAEADPPGASGDNYRISDLELASRLSFFLWSSIPDDELLDAATTGRLKSEAELEREVRRMMADERSRALIDNFAAQWLLLRNVPFTKPDPSTFPDFDDNLRQAFRTETELLLKSVLVEDRSVVDILTADYTFVNERLARHYGIPNIYGSEFRRVKIADGNRQPGILGQGSVLTLTSYAARTSPVVRGKAV